MHPLSTVQPITQLKVKVHAIVEKIAGVNGPLCPQEQGLTRLSSTVPTTITSDGFMEFSLN